MNKPIKKLKIRDVYKYKITLSNSMFSKKYISRIFRIKNVLSTINKYDRKVSFFSFSIFLIFYLQEKKYITKKDITSYNIWFFLSIFPFFQEERIESVFRSKKISHLLDKVNEIRVVVDYEEVDKDIVPEKLYDSIYRQVIFLNKVIEFMMQNIIIFLNSEKKELISKLLKSYAWFSSINHRIPNIAPISKEYKYDAVYEYTLTLTLLQNKHLKSCHEYVKELFPDSFNDIFIIIAKLIKK